MWPWPWDFGLGLRGLALAKNSRPKSWQTTQFTRNLQQSKQKSDILLLCYHDILNHKINTRTTTTTTTTTEISLELAYFSVVNLGQVGSPGNCYSMFCIGQFLFLLLNQQHQITKTNSLNNIHYKHQICQ